MPPGAPHATNDARPPPLVTSADDRQETVLGQPGVSRQRQAAVGLPTTAPRVPATVALVTGASAGIGAAFADGLAADGYDLVLVARGEQRLRDTAAALSHRHGVTVEVVVADLATREGQQRVARRLSDPSSAEPPVELLVNNAGNATAPDFADTDPAALRAALELNVAAVIELTRAALPAMIDRGRGAIVNLSSVNAFLTLPGGAASYGAGKAYVKALSTGIALSLAGSGVQVMTLCPGPIRTDFHHHNRTRDGGGPAWMRHSPQWLVDHALADLHRGRIISVPGVSTKLLALTGRQLPLRLAAFAVRRARRARGETAKGTGSVDPRVARGPRY